MITPLGWQHSCFVCARETKKRVKIFPWPHFLGNLEYLDILLRSQSLANLCTWQLSETVQHLSLHIDESTSEVNFSVIVHAHRGFHPFLPQILWTICPMKSSAGTVLGQRSAEEVGLHITSGSAALIGFTWFHWSRGHGLLQSLILSSFVVV